MQSVFDAGFQKYGQVVRGYDFSELLTCLANTTPKPMDSVVYVPSFPAFEALEVYRALRDGLYGGMDIDLGYCNGNNTLVNCLEYHRGSELQLAVEDTVLPLGQWRDIDGEWKYDLSKLELYYLPGGTAVELSPLTLHDSPFSVDRQMGFRMIIALPRGTNAEKPDVTARNGEDRIFASRNTWMLHYPDAVEVLSGAMNAGLRGERIDVTGLLPFPSV